MSVRAQVAVKRSKTSLLFLDGSGCISCDNEKADLLGSAFSLSIFNLFATSVHFAVVLDPGSNFFRCCK